MVLYIMMALHVSIFAYILVVVLPFL